VTLRNSNQTNTSKASTRSTPRKPPATAKSKGFARDIINYYTTNKINKQRNWGISPHLYHFDELLDIQNTANWVIIPHFLLFQWWQHVIDYDYERLYGMCNVFMTQAKYSVMFL